MLNSYGFVMSQEEQDEYAVNLYERCMRRSGKAVMTPRNANKIADCLRDSGRYEVVCYRQVSRNSVEIVVSDISESSFQEALWAIVDEEARDWLEDIDGEGF